MPGQHGLGLPTESGGTGPGASRWHARTPHFCLRRRVANMCFICQLKAEGHALLNTCICKCISGQATTKPHCLLQYTFVSGYWQTGELGQLTSGRGLNSFLTALKRTLVAYTSQWANCILRPARCDIHHVGMHWFKHHSLELLLRSWIKVPSHVQGHCVYYVCPVPRLILAALQGPIRISRDLPSLVPTEK